MLKAERDGRETYIEASGPVANIAAVACSIIRAIYFELPVEQRELFIDALTERGESGEEAGE